MAKLEILAGTTSKVAYVFIQDSSKTDGSGLTGLVFNSGSLVASYVRPGAARVAITLATQTVTGAWSSGGFVEVDASNMPGIYRLDIPDAALASGVKSVLIMLKGATNMAPCVMEIELTVVDNQSASYGLTNLDATISSRASSSALATVQADTDDIQTRLPAALVSGRMDSSVGVMASGVLTATAIAADAITAAKVADGTIDAATFAAGAINAAAIAADAIGASELAADAVTEIQTGLATSAALATVQADTDDIQSRLPATLVSGRIDASVGAMAADVVTASAIATDAFGALELAAGAASEIATAVRTELTTELGRVDVAVSTRSSHTAADVWAVGTRALTDKAGFALSSAGVQAIWDALTSALTTVGSVGKLLVDQLNATVGSRLAASAYVDHTAAIAAVQSDTDDLQTRLPAVLIGGRIDASAGAIASGAITATSIAADAIGASELAADAASEIASAVRTELTTELGRVDVAVSTRLATSGYTAPPSAATISTTVWSETTRTLTSISALAAQLASAVWDAVATSYNTALSMGQKLNAAGSAGDPWTTALPGAYGSGSAGKIVGDNLNATVGSRLAASAYVDHTAAIAAVQADTDNLQTRLPAALVGGRIDASVGAMAADVLTASALASSAVDEILDDMIGDSTLTVREALRVLVAGMAGKLNGAATTTITIRNLADTADVVVATVDATGNRSAVTVTP